MLLQRLPGESGGGSRAAGEVDDAWRRVQLIGETLTREELRTLTDLEILRRLFNEDDVRLFEPSPVYFAAAARANASPACSRGSVRPRRAPCSPSAARSRCAATSAIAPMCSTPSTSRGCSTPAHRATAAAEFT